MEIGSTLIPVTDIFEQAAMESTRISVVSGAMESRPREVICLQNEMSNSCSFEARPTSDCKALSVNLRPDKSKRNAEFKELLDTPPDIKVNKSTANTP